ncbi:MAG: PUR family DNA/RNA-binding protein [Chitinophagales bacterium]|nr:PUR family DNA/RNA-binding protein [Chitinophagales bacterium]
MENEHNNIKNDIFSKKIRAGKRRTYFFDVRSTKSSDFFLTITESKKHFNDESYDRHKIFIYKEDFNKFVEALQETVDYIKAELLPEYDFNQFAHRERGHDEDTADADTEDTTPVEQKPDQNDTIDHVEKWD